MLKAEYIVYQRIYIKHQLYLLKKHRASFKIWSALLYTQQ